jgi:hypothetical protein
MNSHQRRKDRRYWKHIVNVGYDKVEENDYDRMWEWCRDTFGNTLEAGWREEHLHRGTRWHFTTQEKATMFSLRWL